jgi:SusD/RagB-like outer membrane lipoprotein
MKRLLINMAFLTLLAGGFSSCKKMIADNYLNPELSTTGSMSKLMSGMFLNKRIHPSYYDFATFILPTTGGFSQLVSMAPGQDMYVPDINYNEARWDDYYDGSMPGPGQSVDYNYDGPGIMSSYREMQTTFAALSPTEQTNQYVFLQCAKVLFYDQTAQMVDLWGDIPFSQANSLNTTRSISNAAFDPQVTVYDSLISGLQQLNTYFAAASQPNAIPTEIQSELNQQDMLLGGNLNLWQRYANSLCLRLLMRISYYDQSMAQTQVTAMLANPNTYPLITSNSMNVVLNESPTALKSDLQAALAPTGTGNGLPAYAPAYLLDTVMVANGDPRTAILFDSVAGQPYVGFPTNGTVAQYQQGGYAVYDSATFIYNYNVPGVVFTAAEVSFLTAEANERWGAGSTPAITAYQNGISLSTAFYYNIYSSRILKQGYTPPAAGLLTMPTAAAISAYYNSPNIAYSGTQAQKLALIGTQNWINFFILQAGQAWAEVRRTGYPALNFAVAPGALGAQPPTRLLYPSSEQLYNAANYSTVSGKDTRTTKIFWDVN